MRFRGYKPDLVRGLVRKEAADDTDHLDIRLVVGRFHEFGVRGILIAGNFAERRRIGKAEEEMILLRLLDGDGQGTASMAIGSTDFEAHPFEARPGNGILDFGLAKIQSPLQPAVATFDDVAGFKPGKKEGGVLRPGHQPQPQLVAAKVLDQRVAGVVDLDDVFELHAAIVALNTPGCHPGW